MTDEQKNKIVTVEGLATYHDQMVGTVIPGLIHSPSDVNYDTTNKKITKTVEGTTTDVVTASTLVTDGGGLKTHASRKLVVTNGTASSTSGTITFVESVAGANSGSTGDLTATTTRKSVTIPAAAANGTFSIKTKVGSNSAVTAADFTANQSSADDVTFIQGSNVTLTTDATNRTITVAATDTTYESKSAASGGTDVSLVTTGEKYTWNNKQNALTNPVTGSGLTANAIVLGNGTTTVKTSSKTISTTNPSSSSDDTTIPTSKAVWEAISDGIATNDAMVYKSTIDGGSTGAYGALTPAASKGWTYKVSAAGKINGVAVEVGDILICNADSTTAATSSNYSTIAANWDYIQANIDGAVTGPASSTDNAVAIFDGTGGKVIKSSGFTIGKSVPSNAVFTDTDTKVTSSANHYTPSTASGQDKSASASGATAAWSIDVVKGITLNTDGKGHVTGISVTSGKIPGNPNTDRYVNSAAFADDTTNTADSPVKMTLTRAGSDSVAVTANIPKVSSSSAGVAPKGAAVSTQSQSTKFLREDGTWAAPSYTSNTDAKVTQTATTTSADYEVLFSATADNTTRTEGARKNSNLTFNPSTGNLTVTQLNGVTVGSSPKFTDTDTKVTAVGNHYTPSADSNSALSASATGATAAWSIDVVKAVQLQRDAKGHVTGVTVTSGKIPANPNTDTKVTSAANHYGYAAANATTLTPSGGTVVGSGTLNLIAGITRDGANHVTAITSTAIAFADSTDIAAIFA